MIANCAAHVGDARAERGAQDPLDAPDEHDAAREHGARRTRRNERRRLGVFLQESHAHDEGGIALRTDGVRGHVVVGDLLGAVPYFHARTVVRGLCKFGADARLVPREEDGKIFPFPKRQQRALYDLFGGVVSAHRVYDDLYHILLLFPRQSGESHTK